MTMNTGAKLNKPLRQKVDTQSFLTQNTENA